MIDFLADLHLAPGDALTRGFIQYLDGPARDADAVYILGDLFNVWLGDDMSLPEHDEAVRALRRATGDDLPVYVMRGNRDFLLGAAFARATGVTLLNDPTVIELNGTTTVLSHGDRYCTDDTGYQLYRRVVHSRRAQRVYFGLPTAWRERVADRLRGGSTERTARKPVEITDVNYDAVDTEARRLAASRVIHGHTHRPALHRRRLGRARREGLLEHWVLEDWRPRSGGAVLRLRDTPSLLRVAA